MSERMCPNCGENVPDAKFCAHCGERLSEPEEAAQPREAQESASAPAVPPPPPELEAPGDVSAPEEVTGAEQSGTDLPPSEPPTVSEPYKPTASAESAQPSEESGLGPDELEPRGPHQEPIVARATPMQQAIEDVRSPAPPLDGQLRCPSCGEAVYPGDRVCWSCSRRLEVPEEDPTERPQPPGGEPASGAPDVGPRAQAPEAGAERYQSRASQPQQGPERGASDEAMSYAWWSFGLGLLSVFTCGVLGLLGIAAIWLGVSAARRDAGPVAIAGTVFGVMGLLMLLAWVIALAVVMPDMLRSSPTHVMIPGVF